MRFRKGISCTIAVIAAAAALAACGGSSNETTAAESSAETTASASSEAGSSSEETTTAEQSTERETETLESGAPVLMPLQTDPAVSSNMPDGAYYVQLDTESLKKDGDIYRIKAEFFNFDRYDPTEVDNLKEGDGIKVQGQNIEVQTIERNSNSSDEGSTEGGQIEFKTVAINGGIENKGVDLLLDGEYYRTQSLDDYPLYYSLGEAEIPLSKDVQYLDFGDISAKGGAVYTADQLSTVFEDQKDLLWGPQAISIVVKNGEVIQIFRTYTP